MIGGLSFATITTLLVVPRIYLWLDSLHVWSRRVVQIARGVPATDPV